MSTHDDSNQKLSLAEVAALVVLMAEGREVSSLELERLAGFHLAGTGRQRLNSLGLVASRRVGRTYTHELTDKGWQACKDLLTTNPRTGNAASALFVLLARLTQALERLGLSHAEFFMHERESTSPDLEGRIHATYRDLTKGTATLVSLAELRAGLGNTIKADVDEALRRMHRLSTVHFLPVADPKSLTSRDLAAVLRIGDQDNHMLMIEQP